MSKLFLLQLFNLYKNLPNKKLKYIVYIYKAEKPIRNNDVINIE